MTLSERIAQEDARRREADPPRSGAIMCVRCKAPARDCEHAPAWIRRLPEHAYVRPGGR